MLNNLQYDLALRRLQFLIKTRKRLSLRVASLGILTRTELETVSRA